MHTRTILSSADTKTKLKGSLFLKRFHGGLGEGEK